MARVGVEGRYCCNCREGVHATESGFKQAFCSDAMHVVFCKKYPYPDNGSPRMSRNIAEGCMVWEKQDD